MKKYIVAMHFKNHIKGTQDATSEVLTVIIVESEDSKKALSKALAHPDAIGNIIDGYSLNISYARELTDKPD